MSPKKWTVVRFPAGIWSGGGKPSDPDYAECEVYLVPHATLDGAKKKAQSLRARLVKKGTPLPTQSSPYVFE